MAHTNLYDLLPSIYRLRDAVHAESEDERPLGALMGVLQRQLDVLEEDLAGLYDDAFIETCAEWVIPYIGDLIGYRPIHHVGPDVARGRAEVANTIAYRRRKGTATMLEQLAHDVTGWDARVVEFFNLLVMAQHMNHIRRAHPGTPDLRDWRGLERVGTPFDGFSRTVDVRSIAQGDGRYNLPNIGVFFWRLGAYPVTDSPAVPVDTTLERYLFSPLGCDLQLITKPVPEDEIAHLATELNVPAPLRRRVLESDLDRYYGKEKSFLVKIDGEFEPAEHIRICDLSDTDPAGTWAHVPVTRITVDPVLGRIALPPLADGGTKRDVRVTYQYAFGADLGGGEYERERSFAEHPTGAKIIRVPDNQPTIQQALNALDTGGGIVEIMNSGRYEETLLIQAFADTRVEIRAANDTRPTIVMSGPLSIPGDRGAQVFLNGLVITGGTVEVSGNLERCVLTHTTLVPGISLKRDGTPEQPELPSLVVRAQHADVFIERCIVGGIRTTDDTTLMIKDSLVDGGGTDGVAIAGVDIGHMDRPKAGGLLTAVGSTIFGRVHVETMKEASNVIFAATLRAGSEWQSAPVIVNRRQEGCVRFCYVPVGSRTPNRFRCQPDLAVAEAIEKEKRRSSAFPIADQEALRSTIQEWLVPSFTALRYGHPAYGQLSRGCPKQISTGADDESEMGVYSYLRNPQRLSNLRARLQEYLPIGLEAGEFFVS